jgi:hypothetical protein
MDDRVDKAFLALPGGGLIERGISDLENGRTTAESLLVTTAAPRLEALGVLRPDLVSAATEAPLALYALLGASGVSDPYSTYNALLRELCSFVRALERQVFAERRALRSAAPLQNSRQRE